MFFRKKRKYKASLKPVDYSIKHSSISFSLEILNFLNGTVLFVGYQMDGAVKANKENLSQDKRYKFFSHNYADYYLINSSQNVGMADLEILVNAYSVIEIHLQNKTTDVEDHEMAKMIVRKNFNYYDKIYLRIDCDHSYIGIEWEIEYDGFIKKILDNQNKFKINLI